MDGQTAQSLFVYVKPLGTIVSGSINANGLALIVYSGGTTQQLIDAVANGGCSTSRQAIYTISNGRWITLIPAAPAQVNAAVRKHMQPEGLVLVYAGDFAKQAAKAN